ncbi:MULTISPECIES: CdaR family transcriptional regulator [Bacillus]|uniref:CdaR family transcriptional regulator n=1 Tax=Bacillus TaxID=1386 RepID=UPI000305891C|nr:MULTISPECIES: sugar diacid recognition domain-containing protein [Bacillus]
MLTEELANEIVSQTMIRLDRNINIMNENGIIIASGDSKRIHHTHFGAVEVLRTGKPLIIHENNMSEWEGAKPGINLPITFQKITIGVIGITGNPEEITEFGELVKMITEMMIQQAFLTEQMEWKQRLKELIFEDLLSNSIRYESIDKRLHLLNFKLIAPYQVAIIDLGQKQIKRNDVLQIAESSFTEQQALIGFINVNRLFILTSNLAEHIFKDKLKHIYRILTAKNLLIRIGMGLTVVEQENIKHSYADSISALKHSTSELPLVSFAEIETKALLDQLDERTRQQFSTRILGNLSEKLQETLEQFIFYNLNIEKCSRGMYIHRNSLIYRIKQIKEYTGYDPQNVNDVITLQMAMWMRK